MKLLIIGASRGIGRALLTTALEAGHMVTVLARTPGKVRISDTRLRIIHGDARSLESMREAVRDQDAVCSCIGVPITFKPVDLFSVSARNLVTVMAESSGQKLVIVTGIGAGDSAGHGGFLYDRIFKPLLLKHIYRDKNREEAIIKASTCDWLIVRPAGLTNGPRTGSYRVVTDLNGVTARRISRLDVADFILKQLEAPAYFGKTPLLSY